MSISNGALSAVLALLLSSSSHYSLPAPKATFIIMDSSGSPVQCAIAGEDEVSDSNGVAMGTVQKTSSGWVKVSALGYADAFSKPIFEPLSFDHEQYLAFLTPFSDIALLSGTVSVTLQVENSLSLSIDSDQLSELPAQVGIAEINPVIVGPLFEALSSQQDLNLQMAFAVQAWNSSLDSVDLKNNSTLSVTIIDDQGMDAAPVIATFDLETGSWVVLPDACTRQAANQLQCTLSAFSSLFGVFTDDAVQYTSAMSSSYSAKYSFPSGDMEQEELSFIFAFNHMRQRLKTMEEEGNVDLGDTELNTALSNMMDSATKYAKKNRDEKAKMKLMAAAEAAFTLGEQTLGEGAVDEAAKIADEMGKKLLQADCSQYKEIANVAQQNFMLGNTATGEQLMDKLTRELGDCDVWMGNMTYFMHINDSLFGLAEMQLASGKGSWEELHKVKIFTSPKTLSSRGEDILDLNFHDVKYENDSEECEQSIRYSGSGKVELAFSGSYDGDTFSMGNVTQVSGPGSIVRHDVMEGKKNDECTMTAGYPLDYSYPHFSFLAHGASSPSPPITIQEILDSGSNQHIRFGGYTSFVNDNPQYNTYPFLQGTVVWYFYHVHQVLPTSP